MEVVVLGTMAISSWIGPGVNGHLGSCTCQDAYKHMRLILSLVTLFKKNICFSLVLPVQTTLVALVKSTQ